MKKKLFLGLIMSFALAANVFAIQVSEGLGVYSNLRLNPQFTGGSLILGIKDDNKVLGELLSVFDHEITLSAGKSKFKWTDYVEVDGNGKDVDVTESGHFIIFGDNWVHSFDMGFSAIRLGIGWDIGFYNGEDGKMDFGGGIGVLAGLEFFADRLISVVCDVRPGVDLYGGMKEEFALPVTLSVRLNNNKIKL